MSLIRQHWVSVSVFLCGNKPSFTVCLELRETGTVLQHTVSLTVSFCPWNNLLQGWNLISTHLHPGDGELNEPSPGDKAVGVKGCRAPVLERMTPARPSATARKTKTSARGGKIRNYNIKDWWRLSGRLTEFNTIGNCWYLVPNVALWCLI